MMSRNGRRPSTPLDFGSSPSFSLRGIQTHPPSSPSFPTSPFSERFEKSRPRSSSEGDKLATRELGPDDTAPFHFDDTDSSHSIDSSRAGSKCTVEVDLGSLESIPSLRSTPSPHPSTGVEFPFTPSPPNEPELHDDTMISSTRRPEYRPENDMAGPSFKTPSRAFSPTPMIHDDSPNTASSYSFRNGNGDSSTLDAGVQQRARRGRRPLSAYPTGQDNQMPYLPARKYTDPTPHTRHYGDDGEEVAYDSDLHHQLNVDIYPHEFDDEGRAPTLSFVTTSTAESTASTPSLSASYGGYRPDPLENYKPDVEPRIRMRAPMGRTNAYSSAESSMASGAYSAYGYDHTFADAPPLPTTNVFSPLGPHAGLGISASEMMPSPISTSSSDHASSPSAYQHRPWQSDLPSRSRSGSASSSDTSLSQPIDSDILRPTTDLGDLDFHFDRFSLSGRMPWEDEARREARAVKTVDEGEERILDCTRLQALGGISSLTPEVIASLHGVTHMLFAGIGSQIVDVLSELIDALSSTLLVLDLSNNDLCFLPEALRQCSSLEELNVSANPLRRLAPWVGELTSLHVLVVDDCALQGLPFEVSRLSSLHTVCARGNRLVSLPPWLCLLGQLETLRVENNPFAPEWQQIVAPITSGPSRSSRGPFLSSRPASRQSTNFTRLREAASTHSIASSAGQSFASHDASIHEDGPDGRNVASAVQPNFPTVSLDSISEDQLPHPHTAPIGGESARYRPDDELAPPQPSFADKSLRKMRSAGSLLNLKAIGSAMAGDHHSAPNTANLPPTSASTAQTVGARHGRRMSSAVNGDESEPGSADMTASSSRTGRWGFLRKMSMNKLREKKDVQLSASASANIKLMPPPLPHQHTLPGAPPKIAAPARPGLSGAYSAFTLPTRSALPSLNMSEFGASPAVSPRTSTVPFAAMQQSPSAMAMMNSKRGKRRSFLPIDPAPPSLSVSIPSTSPFMPTTTIFDESQPSLPPANSESTIADDTFIAPTTSASDIDQAGDARYAQGLESIKSYLRDLLDLSRPPIEAYGGFEVVAPGPSDSPAAASSSGVSDQPNSPASALRSSASISQRRRRPTLDTTGSRCVSSTSVDHGSHFDHSFSQEEDEEALDGKKFKNDKAKRARVLREIYETERTYVRGLGELVQIYVRPSQQPIKTGSAESVIPTAERKVVFGGIESILSIHKENLLPALEKAVRPLLEGADDDDGALSAATAHAVGSVFRTYIAYMKQYSTYINNFDNALSRMKAWSASASPGTPAFGKAGTNVSSLAALSAGGAAASVGMSPAMSSDGVPHSGTHLTTSQKKRVKTFLKRAKEHPLHSQINLESYLLLPVQRVPRYKLLLEDLAMCTPPQEEGPRDTLDDALNEIAGLASLMNEEKRDAESRLRLFHWQKRITSRGPSPLVQPHRKLILDGGLNLIRLVKKAASYVEVDSTVLQDGDATVTPSRSVVPVEFIRPEPMDRQMILILCSDLLVLVQPRAGEGADGMVELYNVLRMSTLREPASVVNGTVLRVVDNKSIYYFNGSNGEDVLAWSRAINTARRK